MRDTDRSHAWATRTVRLTPVMTMDRRFIERGFLPTDDPLQAFGPASNLSVLDELGRDLPDLLERADFRAHIARLRIPLWEATESPSPTTPALRLYYLRLGFLASGYVNHLSEPRATLLPRNIAVPLARVCALLGRPPILSYDGYALYNWRRLDPSRPIALGNIETLQNFVRLYDEHWFILVHVEIEAKAIAVPVSYTHLRAHET